MNATLTMVGVPRLVPTLKALSCAAVEVDTSLQAMDWTVMVWHCYWVFERVGGKRKGGEGKECERPSLPGHTQNTIVCSCKHILFGVRYSPSDTNECSTNNGGCAQTCTNTEGSFMCSCGSGFQLESNGLDCDGMALLLGVCEGGGGRGEEKSGEAEWKTGRVN